MDTRDVVGRFEAERQALALMDHSNIAKVFDAGSTPQGRPYFVMELARGEPITDYCDRYKLSPQERLALFVLVCQAVQQAHQKGIIHRDIKPRNVLVTMIDGKAVPKVIDFGVAKAVGQSLTDKTVYTKFAQFLGTPLYTSPEQAELSGVDVDTRADIYALGVLLYELLTGTTPFDRDRFKQAAFDEIRRIIREEEPPKPSTRLSSLGDTLSSVSASRNTEPARLAGLVRGEAGPTGRKSFDHNPVDVTTWDVATGTALLTQSLDSRTRPNAAVSFDGCVAAVATRAEGDASGLLVRLFDLDAKRERSPIKLPNTQGVAGVSFSPDGRRIAILTVSRENGPAAGTLQVRDVETGTTLYTLDVPSSARLIGEFVSRFVWSPDSTRFAFSRDPQNGARIEIHDAITGHFLVKLDQPVGEDIGASLVPTLAWNPDGTRVAAYLPPQSIFGPRVVKVCDAIGGKVVLTFRMTAIGPAQGTKRMMFSENGHQLTFAEIVTEPVDRRVGNMDRNTGTGESPIAPLHSWLRPRAATERRHLERIFSAACRDALGLRFLLRESLDNLWTIRFHWISLNDNLVRDSDKTPISESRKTESGVEHSHGASQ